ncbi:MAG TPA: response regulator transcription factor [Bryobacteraceae bacterium]|nr:response regulator transcription factor [Bryobacteraceae bacterium]
MNPERTRIFLVDDHPLVREWLVTLLRQEPDFEVTGNAGDAVKAMDAMISNPPAVAIVDLSLKASSGLDLIKDLAERLPKTLIIVYSMHEEVFYAERALRAGARGFVAKSEPTDRIIEAIRTVRRGEIYASAPLLAQLTERMMGRSESPPGDSTEALSDREMEVFRRLGNGETTRQIASELHVSIKTVQAYCTRIKGKLRIATGAELVHDAVRWSEHRKPR